MAQKAERRARERSCGRRASLIIAVILGMVASVLFWRRRLMSAVALLQPYVRRRSRVRHPALIINRWSGDGKAEQFGLAARAQSMGIRTIMLERGDDLAQLAHDAIDDGADAIGMAGGDGSLGLIAGVAVARDVPFFCVPVGTRNHFALDLGLDRNDPLAALDAIDHGDEILIDHGMVGDRVFLNNVSLGVYAEAVHRDTYRGEKVGTVAEVLAEGASDPSKVEGLEVEGPNGEQFNRIPLLLISNNPYTFTGPPDFGRRTRLDSGVLGIAAATNLPDPDTIRTLSIDHLTGWHEWHAESHRIDAVTSEVLTGVDGEALAFPSPLDVQIRRKALRVLVPHGVRPGYVPLSDAIAAHLFDVAAIGFSTDAASAVTDGE